MPLTQHLQNLLHQNHLGILFPYSLGSPSIFIQKYIYTFRHYTYRALLASLHPHSHSHMSQDQKSISSQQQNQKPESLLQDKIKDYFQDSSVQKNRLLAEIYRKVNSTIREINEFRKKLKIPKGFTLNQVTRYSMDARPFPEGDFWAQGHLDRQTRSAGLRCNPPRISFAEEDGIQRHGNQYHCESHMHLSVEIEEGAELIYTKDTGKFPVLGENDCMAKRGPHISFLIQMRTELLMIAVKNGKEDSDCVSILLYPKGMGSTRRQNETMRVMCYMDQTLSGQEYSAPYFGYPQDTEREESS